MKEFNLYRRRLIPVECIPLKDDVIVEKNEDVIITKWQTLRPKQDFHHGVSCYFLKRGIKISKFYREDGSLFCWYCDIVRFDFSDGKDALTITDLLADVILYPDGSMKVVDLDELAEAFRLGLLTSEELISSLNQLNALLSLIYENHFSLLSDELDKLSL
jgi:hypothetical protein